MRKEKDSLGELDVPSECYWGAQTQRSKNNFIIGEEKMPLTLIQALALVKKAAARVNAHLNVLDLFTAEIIEKVCDEIIEGKLDAHFPLSVWQTGSGTQTNMNINEVIAHRGMEIGGRPIHPNDQVNASQSSNDVFPTAIHLAAAQAIIETLLPALKKMEETLQQQSIHFDSIIKLGRTHLMDALPLTLGQEFSGYAAQMTSGIKHLSQALESLYPLAIGGTAVGTGLNAPIGFGEMAAAEISKMTKLPFFSASNKFEALASHDACVEVSGALKRLACALMKIANDIRWMGSGPRGGLGELKLPENEPGSSIMPGKINPTQCEALTMVCIQVMGNDVAITMADSQGNFELNVYKPLIIYNLLQSIRLLTDAIKSFNHNCLQGIEPCLHHIHKTLHNSLMLATILNPIIGYDQATKIVQKAYREGLSLREAATALKILTGEEFDAIVQVEKMTGK
mgnify:CR=1 FL=1